MGFVSLATVLFTALAVVFAMVSALVAGFANSVLVIPYMDEIFHIGQVQKYCQGNFQHWDAKITTPPGLYLVSVGLFKPLSHLWPQTFECSSITALRSINVLFTLGNFYLCFAIINKLSVNSQGFGQYYNAINALAVALFPPLYFFTFLYYTDVGSTFTVLLAYLLTLHHNHLLAAVISVMAVLFRQTNIVWVAFLGLLTVKKVVEKLSGKGLQRVNKNSLKYVEEFVKSSLNILANRKNPGRGALIRELTTRCGGYVAVGLGFLGFVLWNQGVALGDRDAHSVTVHLPQVLYCMAFTLVFACPYLVSSDHIRHFVRVVMNHKLIIVILSVVMVVTIALNTVVHPYLLADNRHYTFYIWRWFLGRHPLAKFLLVPLYIYAAWSVFSSLLRSRGLLWTVSFYICVVANLVPQGLLEPRYFILPYIIFRLNLATSLKVKALIIEIFIYFFINIYSLNLFLMHPFVMPDADVLQRFMW